MVVCRSQQKVLQIFQWILIFIWIGKYWQTSSYFYNSEKCQPSHGEFISYGHPWHYKWEAFSQILIWGLWLFNSFSVFGPYIHYIAIWFSLINQKVYGISKNVLLWLLLSFSCRIGYKLKKIQSPNPDLNPQPCSKTQNRTISR